MASRPLWCVRPSRLHVIAFKTPLTARPYLVREPRGICLAQEQWRHYALLRTSKAGEAKEGGPGRSQRPRFLLRTFLTAFNVLGWVSVGYVVVFHVGSIGLATGHSMSPTVNPEAGDKDLVLINRFVFTKLWYSIQRTALYRRFFAQDPYPFSVGDVVFLISPFDPNLMTCKRILALPDDIVSFENADGEKHKMRIPPRHVWVEGDASALGGDRPIRASRDSRQYGPVHMDLINSRADVILWPPRRFGRMPPRPGFDADHMRHLRQMRQARARFGMLGSTHAGRAHSDDSSLTPYIEWEWTTDEKAEEGMQLLGDKDTKPARRRRKHGNNDEERAELMKKIWNQASRGGRLGDDAGEE